MDQRNNLHIDPHSGQQSTVAPPSSPSIHRIVIESRHYDSMNSSVTAVNPQTEASSPRNSQYNNDHRLSIAAMALINELDIGSSTISRRSSVSHHIIVETSNIQQQQQQQQRRQHFDNTLQRTSTITSASNRSSIVGGTLGGPYYFNENSATTLYNPRLDHGRLNSGHYHTASNRASMPPGESMVEEEECDVGSATNSTSLQDPEKYYPRDFQQPNNDTTHQHNLIENVVDKDHRHASLQAVVATNSKGGDGGRSDNNNGRSNMTTSAVSILPPSEKRDSSTIVRKYLASMRNTAKSLFVKYWFLLGLSLVIGMAWLFPDVGKANGAIQAQYTIKWGAVIVIFLLSGLGIDVRVMLKTFLQWRLHLVIQGINFLVMPFLMYGIVLMFIQANAKLDTAVYKGWMIAMSTSTTVSSNVVMTRNAKGNDSGALFNAAFGNFLGIFVCPALMSVFQEDPRVFPPGTPHGNPDYINILRTLGLTVLLPLIVGQIIRFMFSERVKKLAAKLRFPIVNNLALLLLVWSVFCDGVASGAFHQMTAVDIVSIVFVDIFMYVFACFLCVFVARVPWPAFLSEPKRLDQWRFSKQDTIAIMYCGATKTVSMGIPLINVLYAQSSYGVVGVLSLPLLLYHIIQLFIGNFQVQILKNWITNKKEDEKKNITMNRQVNEKPQTFDRTLDDPITVITTSTGEPSSFPNDQQQQQQQQQQEMKSSNYHSTAVNDQEDHYLATPTKRNQAHHLPITSTPVILDDDDRGVTSEQQHSVVQSDEVHCHRPSLDKLNCSTTNSTNNKHKELERTHVAISTRTWDTAVQSSYESASTSQAEHRMFHDITPKAAKLRRTPSFESASSQLSFSSFDNNENYFDTTVDITPNRSSFIITPTSDNNSNSMQSSTSRTKDSTK